MSKKLFLPSVFFSLIVLAFGCSDSGVLVTKTAPGDALSGAVSSGLLSISDSSNEAEVPANKAAAPVKDVYTVSDGETRTLFPTDAWEQVTQATEFYAEITFENCYYSFIDFSLTGTVLRHWNNLVADAADTDKITSGTVFHQAILSKVFTKESTATVITVTGDGSEISNVLPGGTFTGYPVARTYTYDSFTPDTRQYQLDISLTRTKTTEGADVFSHKIATSLTAPLEVAVDIDAATRTITTGEMSVNCQIVGNTITMIFDNVVFNFGRWYPESGTVEYTVTDNGDSSVIETGIITFDGTSTPGIVITGPDPAPSSSGLKLEL